MFHLAVLKTHVRPQNQFCSKCTSLLNYSDNVDGNGYRLEPQEVQIKGTLHIPEDEEVSEHLYAAVSS